MGFVARLRRGTNIINLNASPFTVAADFVPPSVAETPQIAEGRKRARRTGERRSSQSISVSVHVQGSTIGHIRANVDIVNSFLGQAGNQSDPTYFEWKPDTYVSAETILGQGSAYRGIEVLMGNMQYGGEYGWWDRSLVVPNCSLNMVADQSVLGARQLFAEAMGGISEDYVGMLNGTSRGLQIPEGDTSEGNWFTNPIFSNSTWDTGWTAGAGITLVKNTNQEYVIFGTVSAMLACSLGATGTFTASINVGDTDAYMMSCYAVQKNRGALTSTNCKLYWNGSELTTTFTLIGNGVYRLTAAVTGVNASATAGIKLAIGNVIYVDGFQLEKRAFVTPLMCGDFLGHAWTSAGHGSRSTRAASYVRYSAATLLSNLNYTMRIGWVAPMANTAYAKDAYIFRMTDILPLSAEFDLFYDQSAAVFAPFNAANTFAAGEQLVFHLVLANGFVSLYINGVYKAVVELYFTSPASSYIYLGSDDTPDYHAGGRFNDFEVYNGALSAAEVLADYTNILPSLTANTRVSPVGYIWTKDGDSVVDYTFTGDGSYSNIAVIGGAAGSLPAKTEFKAVTAGMNNADVYIGILDVDYHRFVNPEFLTYEGAPDAKTVNTGDSDIATLSIDDDEYLMLAGRKLALMVRGDEDGSDDISLRTGISPGGAYYYSSYKPSDWIASSTNVSNDLSPELGMLDDEELYRLLGITRAVSIKVQGKRPTGTATFNLHSAQIMPFPMIRLVNTSAAGIAATILYLDGKAREVNSAALSYGYSVRGDRDEFGILPGKYNVLVSYLGTEGVATDTGDTLTYSAFYVTPRWALM